MERMNNEFTVCKLLYYSAVILNKLLVMKCIGLASVMTHVRTFLRVLTIRILSCFLYLYLSTTFTLFPRGKEMRAHDNTLP